MNYAELLQALQDYCQTDEATFVSNVPQFVRSAEQKIYRAVRLPATRQYDTSVTITSGTATIDVSAFDPAFLAPLFVRVTDATDQEYEQLLLKDYTFLSASFDDADGTPTGRPRYYAIKDQDTLEVRPKADANYATLIGYLGFPESIVTASTSWLGSNAESALLYGSLVEAEMFRKGESDLYEWYKTKFEEEIVLLADENKSLGGDQLYGTVAV